MSLERTVARWRAERRRALLLEWAARAAGWGAAAAGAVILADHAWVLPRAARVAAWGAGAAALAVHAWTGLARPWREGESALFPRAAERWPRTRALFASAWSLRAAAPARGISEELRLGHLERADALAAELPGEPLTRWTPTRAARAGAAAGAAAALLVAAAGAWPSVPRALAPWRDAPLDELVSLLPGDAAADWGAPAAVEARLTPLGARAGLRADELALEARGADGAWRALPWTRADAESAAFDAGALTAPFDYRVRGRGETGTPRRLTPVPPPRWRSAEAVVHGAKGTRAYALGSDAPVRARRGDWISVRAVPEAPLAEASLRAPGAPQATPLRAEGGAWSGGFLAQESGTLSFALLSPDGRRDPSPPAYAVEVLGDERPVAELLSPQVPLAAGPGETVPIAYAARDDSALTRLELVTRSAGTTARAPLPLERGAAEALGDRGLPLKGLAPGVRLEFWIEASDDASPPQTARSATGSVEVVDAPALREASEAAFDQALAALDRAGEASRQAASAAREGAADARTTAARSAAEWEKAAKALAAWRDALAADPSSNPGLAEQAGAAAEATAEAAREGGARAARAAEAGDGARSAREHEALAEQAAATAKALREGRGLQTAQELAERAGGADGESRGLADDLERLAGRGLEGTVSARELEELERSLAKVEDALEELRKAFASLPEGPAAAGERPRALPLDEARGAAAELRRALGAGDVAAAAKAARELSQRLSELARNLRESGRRRAEESASRAREGASRAAAAWREAAAAQEKAVESARRAEDARVKRLLESQKDLLARAGARLRPGEDDEARRLLGEGKAAEAAARLRAAAGARRVAAVSDRPRAAEHEARAQELDATAEELERGAPAPAPDAEGARPAAQAQALARGKTGRLRVEVLEATGVLGRVPGGPVGRVDSALEEQAAGESALRGGDSTEGLRRAEAALAILQDGERDAAGGESSAESMGQGLGEPFSSGAPRIMRAAPAGSRGTGLGRVRLPGAAEYRPPRELREELERSLREPRPAAHDPAIKEYFRRLAR